MKRYFTLFITAIAAFAVAVATETPRHEFRGVWFTTVYGIDWPSRQGKTESAIRAQKAEIDKYLDRFAQLNLTTVCFQVRSLSDALYHSTLEPWSAVVTGERGTAPGWDPLSYVADGCHRRGLECYAWINPFRWSAGPDYDTGLDRRFKEQGMLLSHDKYTVLNPALSSVHAHILNVCREIITGYPVDGILFDDYFYPNNIPEDSTAADYNLYRRQALPGQSIGDWRRDNINFMMAEIADMIARTRPEVRFGIGPAGVAGKQETSAPLHNVDPCPVKASDWQYATIYSDPLAWLEDGTVDFISPQLYWPTTHATAPYEPLTKWWSDIATRFKRHHYASQSLSPLKKGETLAPAEIITQIELNRKYAGEKSVPGSCYFSAKPLLGSLGDALVSGPYSRKALPPAVNWKYKLKYGSVKHLTIDGDTLRWQPVKPARDNSIVRYAVYAIPAEVKLTRNQRKSLPAEWLCGVTYTPSFRLADSGTGCFYAVTVIDGFGIEHKPAICK